MRTVIDTEKDLEFLQGKFVLQVDSNQPNNMIWSGSWSFVKEKRLKIVVGTCFADLYGYISEKRTFEDFKDIFNNYLFPFMKEKGEVGGKRFHRLLTSKEIEWLCEKLKEENY